jgi:hypothetical protein
VVDRTLQQKDLLDLRQELAQADPIRPAPGPVRVRAWTILVAAAVLLATTTLYLRLSDADSSVAHDLSGEFDEHQVLQRIRSGPIDVRTAAYSLQTAGLNSEMLFLGATLSLATMTAQGQFISARGDNGQVQWDFDALKNQLSLRPRQKSEPNLLDGRALADYLQDNFDLQYRGKVEVGGHPCWLLEGKGHGDDSLRVFVDEVSSLVRKTERRTGSSPPRIMLLSEINLELSEEAFSPAPFVGRDTRMVAPSPDQPGRHHVAIFEPDALSGEDEALQQLSVELAQSVLGNDSSPATPGQGYTSVWFSTRMEQTGSGFLDPEGSLPEGLRRTIAAEDLAKVTCFQDLLDLLQRDHGVRIVLAEGVELAATEHRFFSAVPVAAWLPLNSLLAGNQLRIEVEGNTLTLSPR